MRAVEALESAKRTAFPPHHLITSSPHHCSAGAGTAPALLRRMPLLAAGLRRERIVGADAEPAPAVVERRAAGAGRAADFREQQRMLVRRIDRPGAQRQGFALYVARRSCSQHAILLGATGILRSPLATLPPLLVVIDRNPLAFGSVGSTHAARPRSSAPTHRRTVRNAT